MYYSPVSSYVDVSVVVLVIFVVVTLAIIGLVLYVQLRSPRRKVQKILATDERTPILMSMASMDDDLVLLADGYTPDDLRYTYLMALGLIYSPRSVYGLYIVELPFTSAAHLVGISKSLSVKVPIEKQQSVLEALSLEGDYQDYFTVFVDRGEQVSGRYVLDPKAMQFTTEFAEHYHWEIVDDTLLFLSNTELPSYELVDQFVRDIRPAIDGGRPRSRNSHELPYVTLKPLHMDCPICSLRMQPADEWLACPDRHGILVTGEQLLKLREQADPKLLLQALQHDETYQARQLICPFCKATMHAEPYQNTQLFVDICDSCRYRWIDDDEVTKITGVTVNNISEGGL